MDYLKTLWPMLQPILAGQLRHGLTVVAGYFITAGALQKGDEESFVKIGVGIVMWAVVALWSWWQKEGQTKVIAALAKMKPVASPGASTAEAAKAGIDAASVVVKILIAAFVLSMFLPVSSAMAQAPRPRPAAANPIDQFNQKIKDDFARQNANAQAIVNGTSTDPSVSCDFKVFLGLTPQNLEATIKKCLSDAGSTLVDDTQRALDSAKAYTQTGASAPTPDNDAINCLTPGLAILKAGVIVPAVAEVKDANGNITTAAQPAKSPGLILLFQKYREFVLAGGLTSCKTWVDTAVNATATQAVNNVGSAATLLGSAALLVPK